MHAPSIHESQHKNSHKGFRDNFGLDSAKDFFWKLFTSPNPPNTRGGSGGTGAAQGVGADPY